MYRNKFYLGPIEARLFAMREHPLPIEVHSLSNGQDLVRVQGLQETTELPAPLVDLFNRCKGWKSVEAHAHETWSQLNGSSKRRLWPVLLQSASEITLKPRMFEALLADVYSKLKSEGFFISENEFRQFASSLPQEAPNEIAHFVMITKDRSEIVKKSLQSYVSHFEKFGRSVEIILADDSSEEKHQQANLSLLKDLQKKSKQAFRYLGNQEKNNFLKTFLPENGLSSSLEWLLRPPAFGSPFGANRNAALFDLLGKKFVSVDDDTFCFPGRPPDFQENINLRGMFRLPAVNRFENRLEAIASVKKDETFFFSLVENCLGASLHSFLGRAFLLEKTGLDEIPHPLLSWLLGNKGRILSTFHGLVGDSGIANPHFLFFLEDPENLKWIKREETYAIWKKTREVLRCERSLMIQPAGSCMAGVMSFESGEIVPPFFPVFRQEDALYGEVLGKVRPGACFAQIPQTVQHLPSEIRTYHPQDFRLNGLVSVYQILHFLIRDYDTISDVVEPNYHELGARLVHYGKLSLKVYRELLSQRVFLHRLNTFEKYYQLLQTHSRYPAHWKDDVRVLLHDAKSLLSERVILAPPQILQGRSVEEAEQIVQKLILNFGKTLQLWPTIYRELRSQLKNGSRLSSESF